MSPHAEWPWLDEHGGHAGRGYLYPLDADGCTLDEPIPGRCADCLRPMYYDEADEGYHHALDAGSPCFLIGAEDRPDDLTHPLLAGGDRGIRHASERGDGGYWWEPAA